MRTIDHFGRRLFIDRPFGSAENILEFSDQASAEMFLRSAMYSGMNMRAYRDALRLSMDCPPLHQMSDQDVVRLLARKLVSHQIRLCDSQVHKTAVVSNGVSLPKGANDAAQEARERAQRRKNMAPAEAAVAQAAPIKTTWIEIELVGEDDQPIPNARYVIAGPDKSVVMRGRLNSKGLARKDRLEPGTYMVNFPEFDKDAWEAI
ncbi:MAG: hypothetical protein ACRBBK_12560 [Paracoccaceae bacterium]